MTGSRPSGLPFPPPPPPAGAGGPLFDSEAGEAMWIDVIQQMDSVYVDLVASQTALEDKHDELLQAHELINSVFDAMTDIVIACDAEGTIERVNGAFLSLTEGDGAGVSGKPIERLFDTSEQAAIRTAVDSARAGRHVDQREWHLVSADGGRATISTNVAPRRDKTGRVIGLVFVGRPLGELQRAYRELDEAHQSLQRTQEQLLLSEKMAALGRLVAGVAHELNNPISFVFGNMYSLKRYGESLAQYFASLEDAGQDPQTRALKQDLGIDEILADIGPLVDGTLEGASRVRDIVKDLRRFSSNQKEVPETFDLIRLLRTAADWVAKAQRNPPEIVFDAPDALDITTLNGQLHQVLVNLIQNACDAVRGQDDPRVTVAVEEAGGTIAVSVADNGPGVAEADRDKIFEPFFTTKPIGTGTGLGLYVSYSMVGKMGGRLVYADNPGGGACFTLYLPASAAELPA